MVLNVEGLSSSLGGWYYALVYMVGALAIIFSTSAYQFKRRAAIILFNCFGQICWVLHFLLQGDLTSAIASGISALMLAVFSKKGDWKWVSHNAVVIFFIAVLSGSSLLSFKVWHDVFPILAGIFAVIANSRTKESQLRKYALLWCIFWMFNSIFKGYPIALANDVMCTVSTAVSMVRYKDSDCASEAPEQESEKTATET